MKRENNAASKDGEKEQKGLEATGAGVWVRGLLRVASVRLTALLDGAR